MTFRLYPAHMRLWYSPQTMFSEFSAYWILSALSLFIIISYAFELFGRKYKVPSVLLLLGLGIGLRAIADAYQTIIPNFQPYLEIFGVVGLILIVLEASLDLTLSRKVLPTIAKSLGSAFIIFLASSGVIAGLMHYWLEFPFRICLINAIPLAVVSSAIAIPSIAHLSKSKKDFLVYETTFSDILGIMIFNFVVLNERFTAKSLVYFGTEMVFILVLSGISCLVLLVLIEKLNIKLKTFLIIALLILFYSIGKLFHYSTLFLILGFGLMLNNTHLFVRGKLKLFFKTDNLASSLSQFKIIALEFTFLIRTFFFILFGYSIRLADVFNQDVVILGSMVVAVIFIIRYGYLRIWHKGDFYPELFIAPRGLVTVLLFFSIPATMTLKGAGLGVLFFVILATGVIMMIGLITNSTPRELNQVSETDTPESTTPAQKT